jgi:hypothetical protein
VAGGCHPVLFRIGRSLGESGSVAEASAYFRDLVETSVRMLGADHADILPARASQASWRGKSGDFLGAVAAFTNLFADRMAGRLDPGRRPSPRPVLSPSTPSARPHETGSASRRTSSLAAT